MRGRRRPQWFFSNFAQPMPLPRKLGLALRNTWIKVSHLQSCCGHPGEPGC
jgi:hypothetical protein